MPSNPISVVGREITSRRFFPTRKTGAGLLRLDFKYAGTTLAGKVLKKTKGGRLNVYMLDAEEEER